MLNIFIILAFLGNIAVGCLVYLKGRSNRLNKSFALVSFSVAVWIFSAFMFWASDAPLFWGRMMFVGPIILGTAFLYFTHFFPPANLPLTSFKKIILPLPAMIFLVTVPTNFIVREIISPSREVVYGIGNAIFGIYFILYMGYGFVTVVKKYAKAKGINRTQIGYLLLGTFLSTLAGVITNLALPLLGTSKFNTLGPSFTIIFVAAAAYAIIKHHLMDIRLAITRTGIFVVISALVIWVPFWIGYQTKSWVLSTAAMAIFATIGPIVHRDLQRKAEEALQKEQVLMRRALREFAETLPHLKDTAKLVNELCEGAYEIIKPKFCGVYLFDYDKDAYVLKQFLSKDEHPLPDKIAKDSVLVVAAGKQIESLALDKVPNIIGFEKESYLLPFFREEMLNGFLLLGPKETSDVYDASDVDIFEILRAQCVLAFENCLFWQDEKTRLSREEQIKRHQTMDHFSSSMAHEIDNPATATKCVVGLIRDSIAEKYKDKFSPEDYKEMVDWMNTVVRNSERISDLVAAVRAFSKQDTGEFFHLSLDVILNSVLVIMGPQFKHNDVYFSEEIEEGIVVYGNKIYMEEALVNLMENSIHAVRDNVAKGRKKEIAFKVYRLTGGNLFRMEISDNGYGIKKEPGFIESIFVDYVTTKASTEGSGMGLSRVRKIIQMHKGRIWAESEGKEKGARFIVELPIHHGSADPVTKGKR